MIKRSDEEFIALVRSELERSLEGLDPRTLARLGSASQQALAASTLPRNQDEAIRVRLADSYIDEKALPAGVEERLDQIRQQALARMPRQEQSQGVFTQLCAWLKSVLSSWQVPASLAATGFVMVTAVSLLPGNSNSEFSLEQELTLVATAEDIELYENLDFYLWLAENGFENQ